MNRQRGQAVSGAFVFLLLGVFALFAVIITLFGAQAYRGSVEEFENNSDARILQSFIVNAVQADDALGAVTVEHIGGMDALRVDYDFDGEGYIKRIYCHEGALRELLTDAAGDFDPADGEVICAAGSMTLTLEDNLITVVIDDQNGRTHTAQAALRCAG